jgi:alpha-galactosidase
MTTDPREFAAARALVASVFSAEPGSPAPFSFNLGGAPSAGLLAGWTRSLRTDSSEDDGIRHVLTVRDPCIGLEVTAEAVEYADAPAIEWVVLLRNGGRVDTPLLERIQALDLALACPGTCTLHYNLGALCSADDFAPVERRFRRASRLRLTPRGGRSSSEVLPFFNVERDGEGVVLAVGWTGEWAVEFDRAAEGALQVRAGMDLTRLVLHPGEEIRTPRVLVLPWHGDRIRGHNLLRGHILRHHRPRVDGKLLVVPSFVGSWGATTAAVHLGNLARLDEQRLPVECYWIDAGWFGKGPWHLAPGTWKEQAGTYPRGLREVSDAAHRGGRKFLLWFEPQRVAPGSAWAAEHPEWLLRISPEDEVTSWPGWDDTDDPAWRWAESRRNRIAPGDALLDLGNPDARRFLTDLSRTASTSSAWTATVRTSTSPRSRSGAGPMRSTGRASTRYGGSRGCTRSGTSCSPVTRAW